MAGVTIDNDGPLIPVDDRDRMFQRFVRLDEARTRDGGDSGLGLAIVAEFVGAHGGTVEATESPGGRYRFQFILPIGDTANPVLATVVESTQLPLEP